MKKKALFLPAAALLYAAAVIVGIITVSADPPLMELYRIGYYGALGDTSLLWQLIALPAVFFILSLGVALKKGFIRIPALILVMAAAVARVRGYIGLFNETDIDKMLSGGFNIAVYVVFVASQIFLFAAAFLLFFGEKAKRLKVFKRIDFIGSIVFAAFYLLAAAVALLFLLTETVSLQNIALFGLSSASDGVFFLLFAFAAKARFDAAIADCVEFDALMK